MIQRGFMLSLLFVLLWSGALLSESAKFDFSRIKKIPRDKSLIRQVRTPDAPSSILIPLAETETRSVVEDEAKLQQLILEKMMGRNLGTARPRLVPPLERRRSLVPLLKQKLLASTATVPATDQKGI